MAERFWTKKWHNRDECVKIYKIFRFRSEMQKSNFQFSEIVNFCGFERGSVLKLPL